MRLRKKHSFLSSVVLKTDTGFNKSFTTVNKSDAHLFRINSTRVLRNWHSNILFYYVVGLLPSTTFIIVFFYCVINEIDRSTGARIVINIVNGKEGKEI